MKSETDISGQMQSYNSAFPVKLSSLLTLYFEKFQAWKKLKEYALKFWRHNERLENNLYEGKTSIKFINLYVYFYKCAQNIHAFIYLFIW